MNNNLRLQGDNSISDENSDQIPRRNSADGNHMRERAANNRRNEGDMESLNNYLDIGDDANSNHTIVSDIPYEE
jgi:hypothetical protein